MSGRLFESDVVFLQRLLKSGGLYSGPINGAWGPSTDQAVQAFEERSVELARTLGTFDQRTEANIHSLQLTAQAAARKTMAAIAAVGVVARIISGTRTYAEQDALFRQGRFGNPGRVVTKSRGGQSNHNFGIAWDIGIFKDGKYLGESPLYKRAAEAVLANVPGIEWGGSWLSFPDTPHYQLETGLGVKEVRTRFEAGQRYFEG